MDDADFVPNNLVISDVFTKLQNAQTKRGTQVIERIPKELEVHNFLNELSAIPAEGQPALSEQFSFSPRDGTVSVKRTIFNPDPVLYQDLVKDSVPVHIHLLTVSTDYTRRTAQTFYERNKDSSERFGWTEFPRKPNGAAFCAPKGEDPKKLLDIVKPYLSPVQLHLLTYRDAYLHTIRSDGLPKPPYTEVYYTIEIARRFKPGDELPMRSFPLGKHRWVDAENFERKRAHNENITLWAIQELVITLESLDGERLLVISNVIASEVIADEIVRGKQVLNPTVQVGGGNRMALIRARPSGWLDGRARFPLVQAAFHDHSRLRAFRALDYFQMTIDDEDDPLPTTKYMKLRILGILCLLGSIGGLIYCFRILIITKEAERDTLIGTAAAIFFGFLGVALQVFQGSAPKDGERIKNWLKRPTNAQELWALANSRGTARARVEAVSANVAKNWFRREGLRFVHKSRDFKGRERCEYSFTIRDLLSAGFETSFARNGAEVLIAPAWLHRLINVDAYVLRVNNVDNEHQIILEEVSENDVGVDNAEYSTLDEIPNAILERQVLREARGTWPNQIENRIAP